MDSIARAWGQRLRLAFAFAFAFARARVERRTATTSARALGVSSALRSVAYHTLSNTAPTPPATSRGVSRRRRRRCARRRDGASASIIIALDRDDARTHRTAARASYRARALSTRARDRASNARRVAKCGARIDDASRRNHRGIARSATSHDDPTRARVDATRERREYVGRARRARGAANGTISSAKTRRIARRRRPRVGVDGDVFARRARARRARGGDGGGAR